MRRFKAGDRVRVIASDISARKHGYSHKMEDMVGNTYSTFTYVGDECVIINGIYMSVDDLINIDDKEKDPQIFLFDESLIESTSKTI